MQSVLNDTNFIGEEEQKHSFGESEDLIFED